MAAKDFRRAFDVSRETCARLEAYIALLARWNARINLVSRDTLGNAWQRHIADSAQLLDLAPLGAANWIDLGSGAGLPGLPVAAIAAEKRPDLHVTMVESDARKAAFITAAAREMGLDVSVQKCRIEEFPQGAHDAGPEAAAEMGCGPAPNASHPEAFRFDVVSARALAPLAELCTLAHRFAVEGTVFLFPRGKQLDLELTEATARWHIRFERIASRTNPESTVLRILELVPRP